MTVKAGETITTTMVNEAWGPPYVFAEDLTQRDVSGNTAATFTTHTGAPSATITVTSSGVLMVQWGFEGHNSNTTASTVRIGLLLSGANSSSASTDLCCCCSSAGGAGGNGSWSSSRMHIYTGLSTGSTTVQTQSYISSFTAGAGKEAVVDNVWLLVTQFYA